MWALKRKLSIMLMFVIILGISAFFVYKAFFFENSTCFDKKQNGIENGIDCGGSCEQVCRVQATDVNIIWAKTFEVSNGVSNIAALIENPNFDFEISAIYNIKIFDENGIGVKDFKKRVTLNPGEKRLIFIPSIITGKRKIKQTFIDFENIESLTSQDIEKNNLVVTSKVITKKKGQTRLSIRVKNTSLKQVRDIEVSAVLKNKEGTIINAGKSFIDYIPKRGDDGVEITWPREFDENVFIDVYLRKFDF